MEKSMKDALVDAGPSGQDSTVGDAPAARRLSLLEKPGLMLVAQFALIVGILGVWELLSKYNILDAFFFSRPTAIFAAAVTAVQSKAFFLHLSATLAEAGTGLAIGAAAGIISGFIFARSQLLYKLFDPIISALNTLPRVALAPLFILWFGLGEPAKIALVISVVYFIMLLNSYAAITSIDTDLVDTLRLMGASRWLTYRRLYLPSSVPFLFAGLRISLAFAISAAIVGEMLVARYGLGRLMRERQDLLDTAGTFGVLVIIAALAIFLNGIIKLLELSLTRWRPSSSKVDVVNGSI
jgi:sulfonate transport system permease protein